TIETPCAVVAAGAWAKSLLPELAGVLRVTRQVVGWFEPLDASLFEDGRFLVFIIESRHGMHYGIPSRAARGPGGVIKIAKHHHRAEPVDPDSYNRTISSQTE